MVASEQGGLLEHIKVYNNVSYHNRYLGLEVSYCCIASHPMADIQLVNNSVWGNGWEDWGGGIANGNDQATGVLVRNNAVAGNLSFEIAFEGIDPSGATLDHNLVDGWDGYPGELCGTDCQVGDPLWVAPASGDLHLQAGSPAVDHGSALLAPTDDLDGIPRPQGAAVDIGAYELVVGGSCTLECSAEVPATAALGEDLTFQATATATGCTGAPAFAWNFGDGATATGDSASHAYATAGTYDWSLAVTVDDQSCEQSGTVVVSAPSYPFRYLVPAVIHSAGAAGTQWRTSIAALNPGASASSLELVLRTASDATTRATTLAAGATVEWEDIVVSLFGADAAADTAGAVEVNADQPLLLTSRTYNQTDDGTYGQFLPALTAEQALAPGVTGYLLQVKDNADFRTNVGFANLLEEECEVRLELHDAAGAALGAPRTVAVPARGWKQENDVFTGLGAGDCDLGFATVEVLTSGGAVWAYASVVDNRTGDATTIPVQTE